MRPTDQVQNTLNKQKLLQHCALLLHRVPAGRQQLPAAHTLAGVVQMLPQVPQLLVLSLLTQAPVQQI